MLCVATLSVVGLSFACSGSAGSVTEEGPTQSEGPIYYPSPASWQTSLASYIASNSASPFCNMRLPDGTYQPGKLWSGTCRVEYGYTIQRSTSYALLYNDGRYSWFDGQYNQPPANAVIGDIGGAIPGQPNTHVYLCEALINGYWYPGKWWAGACALEYGDRAVRVTSNGYYGVLKFLTHP